MSPLERIDALVGLQQGERHLIGLLFVQYFFTGCASALTQAAGFALFLATFSASELPYTFLIMSVVISALTTLYLQAGRFTGLATQLKINLFGQILLTGGFAVGLGLAGRGSWLVFCLPVLFQIVIVFGNMAFWSLAGRMLNVQQAKRLFGVLGTGEWLAMVLMGLLVPVIVPWLGLENLFWLAAAAMSAALLIMTLNMRMHRHILMDSAPLALDATPRTEPKPPRLTTLLRNRYVLVLFCLTMAWWVGFFFIDNIFYAEAAGQYPEGEALAGFIGQYLSIVGILTVLGNLFVAGPVVSRLGLRWSLLVLPVGLVAGAAIMTASGLLAGPAALLFLAAVGTKIWSVALGFSVDQAARSILVQPFPARDRTRVQTLIDGVAQPISTGAAGLLLLGIGAVFPASTAPLVVGLVLAGLAHVAIVELAGRGYARALVDALGARRLGGSELGLDDPASRAILLPALDHPHPGSVTYAMRMLATAHPESLVAALPKLLRRPEVDIRRFAIAQCGALRLAPLAEVLRTTLVSETIPDLRAAAVSALGQVDDKTSIRAALGSKLPLEKRAALVEAIRLGMAEGQVVLRDLLSSPSSEDRGLAATVAVECPSALQDTHYLTLLNDPDTVVRRQALRAAGRAARPELWPAVIAAVAEKPTRSVAMAALAAGGASAIPAIGVALADHGTLAIVATDLTSVLGRTRAFEAVPILLPLVDSGNARLRGAAIAALASCGYQVAKADMMRFADWVRSEASFAAWSSAVLSDLGGEGGGGLPAASMALHIQLGRRRMSGLLALLGDSAGVGQAAAKLDAGDARTRSYALEVLDIATPLTLKPMVLPVIEALTPADRVRRLNTIAPQERRSRSERLSELVDVASAALDAWTAAAAIHALGVDGTKAKEIRGAGVYSTVEKVIMLRSAGLFSETADDVLADVAAIATESVVAPGESILVKGAPGDSMFVIASGRVRVHDESRTLAELGPGEPFGEMALIDPEPRSAFVTALEETQLLRIDQDAFFELVDERPEVARGLLRVLSRRLRNAN